MKLLGAMLLLGSAGAWGLRRKRENMLPLEIGRALLRDLAVLRYHIQICRTPLPEVLTGLLRPERTNSWLSTATTMPMAAILKIRSMSIFHSKTRITRPAPARQRPVPTDQGLVRVLGYGRVEAGGAVRRVPASGGPAAQAGFGPQVPGQLLSCFLHGPGEGLVSRREQRPDRGQQPVQGWRQVERLP